MEPRSFGGGQSTLEFIHSWNVSGVEGPATFSLLLDPTGSRLIEQFCGSTCVTRTVNLSNYATIDLDAVHDRAIGVTESELIVMTGCCSDMVEPTDVIAVTDAGTVTELTHGVWAAKFVVTGDGSAIVAAVREGLDGTAIEFLVLDLRGHAVRPTYAVPVETPGSFPVDFVGSSADPMAGLEALNDDLLLAPGGRVTDQSALGVVLPLMGGDPTTVVVER